MHMSTTKRREKMLHKEIIHPSFIDQPDLKNFFKILSLPIGSVVIIKNAPRRKSLKKYDGHFAEILFFIENRYVKVKVQGEGETFSVPLDNIEVPGDIQPGCFYSVYNFIKNYFCHSAIMPEKKQSEVSLSERI